MSNGYRCVLLFGAPGVGKGTQGARLGEESGLVHLATGDIFRGLDPASEAGQKFAEYSSRGDLVPNDLTIKIWKEHVESMVASGEYNPNTELLLLDGMPRSVTQTEMLDGVIDPLVIIHLVVPDVDEMVHRITDRAKEQGRHDDTNEAIIRNRFAVYEAETAPVLHHYDSSLIRDVDAIGTIDEVTERVRTALAAVWNPCV